MSEYVKTALNFIEAILNHNLTPDGAYDLFEIHHGNKEIILGHLRAINSITEKAIKELEEENVFTPKTEV